MLNELERTLHYRIYTNQLVLKESQRHGGTPQNARALLEGIFQAVVV